MLSLMMGLIDIFPEPEAMSLSALLFMMAGYGYILCRSSEVIGDGSEMLMLLFGPGIVGGLVIPILGAIPDCAVILISGLGQGTRSEIQHQLAVGVGTLVGSTVMLLTVPWALGIYLGRRDYDEVNDCAALTASRKPKLTQTGLMTNCVTVQSDIALTARVMLLSLCTYLVIQLPSFAYSHDADGGVKGEKPWALACLLVSIVGFLAYCYSQVQGAEAAERDRRMQEMQRRDLWKRSLDRKFSEKEHQGVIFKLYDKDHSGYIEPNELAAALEHLGLKCGRKDLTELIATIDIGHADDGDAGKSDGRISLREFQAACDLWVASGQKSDKLQEAKEAKELKMNKKAETQRNIYGSIEEGGKDNDDEGDDEEEEEDEEQFLDLTESELLRKALGLLVFGTLAVTVFSDPMVDVISEVGVRLEISPFYIAFVVAPLASNASEVYSGLMFARKKTNESISMTLATLHGAATMNSTLALSIFMAIIYARGLEWEYTAEVLTVIIVVTIVAFQSMLRRNIFLWQAVLVGSLYPGAIFLVWAFQTLGLK